MEILQAVGNSALCTVAIMAVLVPYAKAKTYRKVKRVKFGGIKI